MQHGYVIVLAWVALIYAYIDSRIDTWPLALIYVVAAWLVLARVDDPDIRTDWWLLIALSTCGALTGF